MNLFPPHLADFYKPAHLTMYPDNTEVVYTNFTPRSDDYARWLPDFDHKVVNYGLQGVVQWMLIDLWRDKFFSRPKEEVLAKLDRRLTGAVGPSPVVIQRFSELHDHGRLPLLIKALPEGVRVPIRVPLLSVRNIPGLKHKFPWLPGYIETQISSELWKKITCATIAYEYWRLFKYYADLTGSPQDFIPYQGHNFSARGMSGVYDFHSNTSGHQLPFYGTDTISELDYIEDYYGTDTYLGGSIPAMEHLMSCLGGQQYEIETIRRIITQVYPTGNVSVIGDTWDLWGFIYNVLVPLKPEIMARQPNALGHCKVVLRPDSGDPVKIVLGDMNAPVGSPAYKGVVQCLWEIFGGTMSDKGYRILDPHIGCIYGDSINLQRASAILAGLAAKGFASCNIVLGIGSYTYQSITRDTFGHGYKGTWAQIDGVGHELFKDPITDSGVKRSLKGLLRVEMGANGYEVFDQQTEAQELQGCLEPVFNDGELKRWASFRQVRNNLGCIVT